MKNRNLSKAKKIAQDKHIDGELKISTRKNKRFMITNQYGTIHFGLFPYKIGTYMDHGDDDIRKRWIARHSKILKNKLPAYQDPSSPAYYSYHILW